MEKPNVRFQNGEWLDAERLNNAMVAVDASVEAGNQSAESATAAQASASAAQGSAQTAASRAEAAETAASNVQQILEDMAGSADPGQAVTAQVTANTAAIQLLNKGMGVNATITNTPLSVAKSGKIIRQTDGVETSRNGFGISNTVHMARGCMYLIPVSVITPGDVSFLSRVMTRTYDKVIAYIYTYKTITVTPTEGETEEREVIDTATADYDSTLVYTYAYNADGTVASITRAGQTYTQLPATRNITEQIYKPMVEFGALPDNHLFAFLATADVDVVICNVTGELTGNVQVLAWGTFFDLVDVFLGVPQDRVMCEAVANLTARIEALESQAKVAALSVGQLTMDNQPLHPTGAPYKCHGDGAPSDSVEPDNWPGIVPWNGYPLFVGQQYYDRTNHILYEAESVTASTGDWHAV